MLWEDYKKGIYDLIVHNLTDDTLILEDAFTFYGIPEIISVDPISSTLGETIDLTITGEDTHFSQATNTTMWFSQATSTIIYPNYIDIQNDTSILANFTFAITDSIGLYDVVVDNSIDGEIKLDNEFFLNQLDPDTFLVSLGPTEAYENQYITFTIAGNNTNFSQGSNTIWFQQDDHIMYRDYIKVISDNYIKTGFLLWEDYKKGIYDLIVHNPTDDTLILEDVFTLHYSLDPELISATPNEAEKGDIIEVTISGRNTAFDQTTTTLWLTQGGSTIYPIDMDIVNDTEITSEFAFHNSYQTGNYHVYAYNILDGILNLESEISLIEDQTPPLLISNSPDNSKRNEDVTITITGENTHFNYSTNNIWLNQGNDTIYANNSIVNSDTKILADFGFSVTDSIGLYNLNVFNILDGSLILENSFTLSYGTFISENELNEIIVFPNPTNGDFRIDNIPNLNCTIRIISMDGKVVESYINKKSSYIDISLSNLKGYYLIQINNHDFQVTRKILIF